MLSRNRETRPTHHGYKLQRVELTNHEGQVTNIEVVFSDEDVVTAPLTGNAHGIGAFRCTRLP